MPARTEGPPAVAGAAVDQAGRGRHPRGDTDACSRQEIAKGRARPARLGEAGGDGQTPVPPRGEAGLGPLRMCSKFSPSLDGSAFQVSLTRTSLKMNTFSEETKLSLGSTRHCPPNSCPVCARPRKRMFSSKQTQGEDTSGTGDTPAPPTPGLRQSSLDSCGRPGRVSFQHSPSYQFFKN